MPIIANALPSWLDKSMVMFGYFTFVFISIFIFLFLVGIFICYYYIYYGMGVTKCVLFSELFSSRRGRQSYPQPVNNLSHLWITCVRQIGGFASVLVAFRFICATVQVGAQHLPVSRTRLTQQPRAPIFGGRDYRAHLPARDCMLQSCPHHSARVKNHTICRSLK